ARGDSVAAEGFCESALRSTYARKELFIRCILPRAETMLAVGDLAGARQWADDNVLIFPEAFQVLALASRARVALAQGEQHRAECDAYDALEAAERTGGYLRVPDAFECLATIAAPGSPERAARLLGSAQGIRERQQEARFTVFDRDHAITVAALTESLGAEAFEAAMSDGAALGTAEAIAFARRGRGYRKRPSNGWEALTPTELDVVRLLGDGLSNKEIAARLFISPRTAQTHLTHVYNKLDLSSRVQVVQEAARHGATAGRRQDAQQ
ncbi:MAG: response regulator transcription factor, partial [Pirellulales bacterium]